jgi:hypothetical protein
VLIIAHALIRENPGRNDSQNKQGNNNVKGCPGCVHGLLYLAGKNRGAKELFGITD